jgi:hypothetical protein
MSDALALLLKTVLKCCFPKCAVAYSVAYLKDFASKQTHSLFAWWVKFE